LYRRNAVAEVAPPAAVPESDPWLAALAGLLVGLVLGASGLTLARSWRRRGVAFERLLATGLTEDRDVVSWVRGLDAESVH
jgi:hypothetical protein